MWYEIDCVQWIKEVVTMPSFWRPPDKISSDWFRFWNTLGICPSVVRIHSILISLFVDVVDN
jgi:hypothetical protein